MSLGFLHRSFCSLLFTPHTAHGVSLFKTRIFFLYYLFSPKMEYSLSYVFFFDTPFKILIFCTVFHDLCHMSYHSLLLVFTLFCLKRGRASIALKLNLMIHGMVLLLLSLFLFFANVPRLRAPFRRGVLNYVWSFLMCPGWAIWFVS